MMLVQRPTPIAMPHNTRTTTTSRNHRRNPSTPPHVNTGVSVTPSKPTIHVGATKTPGLLTLSRPQSEKKPQRSPRSRPAVAATNAANDVNPESPTPASPVTATPASKPTSSPDRRGRPNRKDGVSKRPLSPSKRLRKSTSQPPAAAAAPSDPFTATENAVVSTKSLPIKVAKPAGKTARKRYAQSPAVSPPPSPTQSKGQSSATTSSSAPTAGPAFPICDDSFSPPPSPQRLPVALPLPLIDASFTPRPKMHKRGVSMSASPRVTQQGSNSINKDSALSKLFAGLPLAPDVWEQAPTTPDKHTKRRTLPASSRSFGPGSTTPNGIRPFFASSVFQNSPGPEDLPPPAF